MEVLIWYQLVAHATTALLVRTGSRTIDSMVHVLAHVLNVVPYYLLPLLAQ